MTHYIFEVGETKGPPSCRFQATFNDFDLDCKVGYGPTPEDAIIDLLEMHSDHLARFAR